MTEEQPVTEPKQRHGCLTVWLIFMIFGNSLTALIYSLGVIEEAYREVLQEIPNAPVWLFLSMGVVPLFNIGCVIALFRWKKYGFWGICASMFVASILNLTAGFGGGSFLVGLIPIVVLYGVLQIGQKNKGWPQLD
jgi:hypothetical protein